MNMTLLTCLKIYLLDAVYESTYAIFKLMDFLKGVLDAPYIGMDIINVLAFIAIQNSVVLAYMML